MSKREYRVGIDIGGTFTDLVAYDEEKSQLFYSKYPTTPENPLNSFIKSIERAKINLGTISILIHATTLGTNIFFGQAGLEIPNTVLITNKGFRDVIEIGRQNRPELYNLFFHKPTPLVKRGYRVGVKGRVDSGGNVIEDLDEEEVRRVAEKYVDKADVFIIVFLNSYLNPIHEKRVKEIITSMYPDKIVVASHEIDPQPKEYERGSTTLINGILKPMLSRYLSNIERNIRADGFKGVFLMMRSDGGVSSVKAGIMKPAAFIESGPAAGAVATAYFSNKLGVEKALGFDMGGTTAKASAILNGEPEIVSEYEVGGRVHMGRIIKGSGYPLRIPHIDLAEVSAGGGTVAWIDSGGALRVGPYSVGADPGPVCYNKGGVKPTITDANLVLGRISDTLAGGLIKLRRDLAYDAVKRLSDSLGIDVSETAYGIIRLADHSMMRALRLVSLERGHDPREFILFAFGGAGPLHAVSISEVGVKEVIIPPYPGVFSALGLISTDYKHDYVVGVVRRIYELSSDSIMNIFREMEGQAFKDLVNENISRENIRIMRFLEMRYWGQAYELRIPFRESLDEAVKDFNFMHSVRYGYSMADEDVEVVAARIEAVGITSKPKLPVEEEKQYKPRVDDRREVYMDDVGWIETDIYYRDGLRAGAFFEGPAIVEEETSTILIPSEYTGYMDSLYNLHIRRF